MPFLGCDLFQPRPHNSAEIILEHWRMPGQDDLMFCVGHQPLGTHMLRWMLTKTYSIEDISKLTVLTLSTLDW